MVMFRIPSRSPITKSQLLGLRRDVISVRQEGIPAVGGLDDRDRPAYREGDVQFNVPLLESAGIELHDVGDAYPVGEDQKPRFAIPRNRGVYISSTGRFDDRNRRIERSLLEHIPTRIKDNLLQRSQHYVAVDDSTFAFWTFAHEVHVVVEWRRAECRIPE